MTNNSPFSMNIHEQSKVRLRLVCNVNKINVCKQNVCEGVFPNKLKQGGHAKHQSVTCN